MRKITVLFVLACVILIGFTSATCNRPPQSQASTGDSAGGIADNTESPDNGNVSVTNNDSGDVSGHAGSPDIAISHRQSEPAAGLYAQEWPIAAGDIPVAGVAANEIAAAFGYINQNPGTYTLLIDRDVRSGSLLLGPDGAEANLTIIGLGGERTIQYNGPANHPLLNVGFWHPGGIGSGHLTLGNNITLKGINNSETSLVIVETGTLTMKAGSKITGHTTRSKYGAVFVSDNFIMEGGEISGNTSSWMDDMTGAGGVYLFSDRIAGNFVMSGGTITNNWAYFGTGGVLKDSGSSFTMSGGTISGNIWGPDKPEPRDVWIYSNYGYEYIDGTVGAFFNFWYSQSE